MDKIYKKAFTLIELLAIVVVISILTVIFFVDYGKDSKVFALERASRKVSQDLRRAQEMAASGLVGEAGTNGYGVYFEKTVDYLKYIIYTNKNVNKYYEPASDSLKEDIGIEAGIKICDIKYGPLGNMSSVSNASVSFQPPDPINYIQNNHNGYEASITLCVITNTNQKRTININNTGRIEITNP
jgi:type II secretory pathway pseudopilin PulG